MMKVGDLRKILEEFDANKDFCVIDSSGNGVVKGTITIGDEFTGGIFEFETSFVRPQQLIRVKREYVKLTDHMEDTPP